MTKTNKSILKRLRITKKGKVLRTATGINHFQAKKSRQKQLRKKSGRTLDKRQGAIIKSYLYH